MIEAQGICAVLTDIEGTTGSIAFVHDVLFPYARERLGDYVRTHEADIADILDEVRRTEGESLSADEVIAVLERWIDEDRKATPLKELQGRIWAEGYATGAFKGHVYADAVQALQKWRAAGLKLYVYSSGSVEAQKLLFGHSDWGDLTPWFEGFFDTRTGPKLKPGSYTAIAVAMNLLPSAILFLSDSAAEIDAARTAGMQVIRLDRGAWDNGDDVAHSFSDITINAGAMA